MNHKNIFLLLGSNVGNRLALINLALAHIEKEVGNIILKSKIYETAPWGKTNQPDFLNQAVELESELSPFELLSKTQSIEKALGRTRIEKWSERTIDIDLLYFGREKIHTPDLTIPHPHLAERRFVLVPLVEISPEFIHPDLQRSNEELLMLCNDKLQVKEFKG